jgi:hypothetical protein
MQSRETIYLALFNLLLGLVPNPQSSGGIWSQQATGPLSAAQPIAAMNRRFVPYSRADIQPAICMVEVAEQYVRSGRGAPPIQHLTAHLFLYTRDGADPNAVSASALNAILDRIDATIFPVVDEQTLGGLISWARVTGRQSIYDAQSDLTQATTVIEIQMLGTA